MFEEELSRALCGRCEFSIYIIRLSDAAACIDTKSRHSPINQLADGTRLEHESRLVLSGNPDRIHIHGTHILFAIHSYVDVVCRVASQVLCTERSYCTYTMGATSW